MAHPAEPAKAALACGRKRHAKTGKTDSRSPPYWAWARVS